LQLYAIDSPPCHVCHKSKQGSLVHKRITVHFWLECWDTHLDVPKGSPPHHIVHWTSNALQSTCRSVATTFAASAPSTAPNYSNPTDRQVSILTRPAPCRLAMYRLSTSTSLAPIGALYRPLSPCVDNVCLSQPLATTTRVLPGQQEFR
jgi:hypothetical protein